MGHPLIETQSRHSHIIAVGAVVAVLWEGGAGFGVPATAMGLYGRSERGAPVQASAWEQVRDGSAGSSSTSGISRSVFA